MCPPGLLEKDLETNPAAPASQSPWQAGALRGEAERLGEQSARAAHGDAAAAAAAGAAAAATTTVAVAPHQPRREVVRGAAGLLGRARVAQPAHERTRRTQAEAGGGLRVPAVQQRARARGAPQGARVVQLVRVRARARARARANLTLARTLT